MPAFSSHCIFAREVLPLIYTNVDFEINEEALMIGAQGPDIFFFHRVFPWMPGKSQRKIGSMLHRAKPAKTLGAMRYYCENISHKKNIARSYVCGFILHYALDRSCHPYVYSFQNKMTQKKPLTNPHTAHNIIELSMDSYLLWKRYAVENPAVFDTACTVGETPAVLEEIGRLYEYTVSEVLDKSINKSTAAAAIRDMKRVQSITHDATGVKRFFINIIDTVIAPFSKNYKFSAMLRPRDLEKAKKYGNIDGEKWKSPFDGSVHTESFEDLFDLAKPDAMRMLREFQNGNDTEKITNNLSFLTGVKVK